ncbi:MAG: YIP1 family protein [Longimicrobiales bacterium]
MIDPPPPDDGAASADPLHSPDAAAVTSELPGARFPWPPRPGESIPAAAIETWRDSVFHPVSFFRRMPPDVPLGPVLLYMVAVAVVAAGIQLFWEMVWLTVGVGGAERSLLWLFMSAESPASALIGFLLTPLLVLAILYIGGAITHGILMLLGGATLGFGATLRVYAFSYGPQVFLIVPLLGWIVAAVWSIALTIVGLREVHTAPGWKPAAAVLAPLGCLMAVVLAIAVMLAMGALLLPEA